MAENDPKIVLLPHQRSHQFVRRDVQLREPAMVGRSVARAKILPSNLIFDCRVLSRSHAVIWFDSGKFYIKDTKSSNGTFVNDRRLSRSGEESAQYELKSGDIVQFGVNVEGPSRVTHGCIIGSIQLFIDNKELPSRDESPQEHVRQPLQADGVSEKDIEDALKIVQAAYRSEQELEMKLSQLQTIVTNAKTMASENMVAIVKEDQLLSRLEMMENQLRLYTQDQSEEDIRSKLSSTLEEKHRCEEAAKSQIHLLLNEKATNVAELAVIKQQLEDAKSEVHRLTTRLEELQREHDEEQSKLADQLKSRNEQYKKLEESFVTEKTMSGQREEELRKMLQTTKLELDSVKEKLEDAQKELRIVKMEKDSLQKKLYNMEVISGSRTSSESPLDSPLTDRQLAGLVCEAVILKGQVTLMNEAVMERNKEINEIQKGMEGQKFDSSLQVDSAQYTLTPTPPDWSQRYESLEKESVKLKETVKKLIAKNKETVTHFERTQSVDRKAMEDISKEKNMLTVRNESLMRQLAQMTENYNTLKRSSEEGHGPLQAKTVEKNEEPNSLISAIFCFSVGIAVASIFFYYIHNTG